MTIQLPGVVSQKSPVNKFTNKSTTAQTLTAATEAIITGASVQIPDSGLQDGSKYRVRLSIDKTAAGTATSAYTVGLVPTGEAVSVANMDDLLSFTKPAGTAAIDVGVVEIELFIVTVGTTTAESGSVKGTFVLVHNLAATGHAQVPVVVLSGLDATTATVMAEQGGGYMVLSITTGAADVSDVLWVEAELTIPAAAP